ncbi:iron uptake porin [Oculatella sp. FACHB-28]|uniref:iron uptake porin n=1 Tax=Oculatella sp. FACHB-28 TaxID=2692845 RepID=UPI001F55A2A5|nr:iron uptake porin [Oculatella sp. FACHB-28]
MSKGKKQTSPKVGLGLLCLLTGLMAVKPLNAAEAETNDVDPEGLTGSLSEITVGAIAEEDASNQESDDELNHELSDSQLEHTASTETVVEAVEIPEALFVDVPEVVFSEADVTVTAETSEALVADSLSPDVSGLNTPNSTLPSSTVTSSTTLTPVPSVNSLTEDTASNSIGQVTSVSQLSDVQPTDWAFQALQSLVERYGVIAGYPDGTYRGNRALTRYEFAAGLNAALDRVNELIAAGLAEAVTREDLTTLQRLQEEFSAELATLRGRVDTLEARTAELEANQFSTTTRLNGEVVLSIAAAGGGYPGGDDSDATPGILSNTGGAEGNNAQIVFNNRVRLNLTTSFTGSDLLITGLQSYNFGGGFGNSTGSIPGTLGLGDPIFGTASNLGLAYAPQFGTTNPQNLSNSGSNDIDLYKLLYIFPAFGDVTLFVGTNAEVTDAFPAIAPFASDSQGALSRFGGYNPAVRVSGGTSGTGLASAAGFIWDIADGIDLRGLYGSVNASLPNNQGLTGGTPLGAGLFNGSYVLATQLTLTPSDTLNIGLNYANSYHQINILGTGLSASDIGSVLFNPNAEQLAAVGGNEVLAVANEGIRLNSIGATVNWQFAPGVDLTLSGAYIFADLVDVDASTNFISWMAGVHFRDIFGEGNTAALLVGQPLNRASVGGEAYNPENADPFHLEGFINFRLNDNISITPGVYVVFDPEGYSGNSTTAVGALRTTFTF